MREPTTTVTCAPNCGVSTTPTTTTPTESSAVGGKLAQSYVKDAQVWADQLVDGVGNLEWDDGEPLALSGEEGDYQLTSDASWVLSGDFQIVTSGGKKTDSSGNWIDAAPMVAPAPEPGQASANVTPLTTLVAFEPALKAQLDALGGWNADIASPNGVSGNLLRVAKTVETLSSSLSGGSSPVVNDFGSSLKSLGKLAATLKSAAETGADLASDEVLEASASSAIEEVLSDPVLVPNPPSAAQKAALKSSVAQAVQGIAAAIQATDEPVVEDPALLDKIEKVLEEASVETLGGKLAQKYVKGAQVWADQLVDGVGNLEQDKGEPLALSGENGDYQLTSDALWVLSGDFQIVAYGGAKKDSNGNWIDAAPMLAPAPEPDQAEVNVTPLTTLVTLEPSLKAQLDDIGGWNADIASPNGVSGNLLRIAKIVEAYSFALSGGSSPVVSDLNSSLRSVGKLAATLKTATEAGVDLASDEVLEESASSAIDEVLSDLTLVPDPPSVTLRAALKNSVTQAVQGIAAVIPATDELVVEDTLLAQIEQVLREAGIVDEIPITLNMGTGSTLSFGAVITQIEMTWVENSLLLTAVVSDDDPDSLDYRWFTFSETLRATNPNLLTTEVTNFDGTSLKVLLTAIDSAANTSDTRSCTWQSNPTICEF